MARQLDEEQRKAVVKENLTKKIDEGKVETSMSNAEKAKMRAELEAQR